MKMKNQLLLFSSLRRVVPFFFFGGINLLLFCCLGLFLPACRPNVPQTPPPSNPTATSLDLKDSVLEMIPGEQRQLNYTVTPKGASVSFDSSAPNIVFVDSKGTLSALKEGKAIVRLKAGNYEAFCKITVEQKDDSQTFETLPLPRMGLIGNTLEEVKCYEGSHNGILDPRLSYFDESRQANAYAFNVNDDVTKVRIYYLQEVKGYGERVQSIALLVSPIEYVFELKGDKARLNQAFRRLMTQNLFFVSNISAYGVAYINPEQRIGVQVAPSKHPELGLLAQLEYKSIAR